MENKKTPVVAATGIFPVNVYFNNVYPDHEGALVYALSSWLRAVPANTALSHNATTYAVAGQLEAAYS